MKTNTGVPGVTGTTPELPEIAVRTIKRKADSGKNQVSSPAYKNKTKKYVRKNGLK